MTDVVLVRESAVTNVVVVREGAGTTIVRVTEPSGVTVIKPPTAPPEVIVISPGGGGGGVDLGDTLQNQVLFNLDGTKIGGSDKLTFDKTTGTLSLTGYGYFLMPFDGVGAAVPALQVIALDFAGLLTGSLAGIAAAVGSAGAVADISGINAMAISGGNAPTLYGASFVAALDGSATANDVIGVFAGTQTFGGVAQNMIGVSVGDVVGGVNNYAIQTGAGVVQFGDELHLATTTTDDVAFGRCAIVQAVPGTPGPNASLWLRGSGEGRVVIGDAGYVPPSLGMMSVDLSVMNRAPTGTIGHWGIMCDADGNAVASGSQVIAIGGTANTPGSGDAAAIYSSYGMNGIAWAYPQAGRTDANAWGGYFYAGIGGGAGTLNLAVGVGGLVNSYGGTTTDAAALYADVPYYAGGAITNLYGLLVRDQTGAVNNWAIKTGLGKVEFGDELLCNGVVSFYGAVGFLGAPVFFADGGFIGATLGLYDAEFGRGVTLSGMGTGLLELTSSVAALGAYTLDNSGIVIKNAAGVEIFRVWGTDPDTANYNSVNLYIGARTGAGQPVDNVSAGYGNIGIGSDTLAGVTTGGYNVAIGTFTMALSSSGSHNISLGTFSLMGVTGDGNLALGTFALAGITTGSGNVAIGTMAGSGDPGMLPLHLTRDVIGRAPEDEASTIDDYMVFVGALSGRAGTVLTATKLTNGIAIGYNTKVAASNTAVIGNDAVTDVYFGGMNGTARLHGVVSPGISMGAFYYTTHTGSQQASDPGPGKVRWNHATQQLATEMYFDWITEDGFDPTQLFIAADIGTEFVIQDKDFALKWQKWRMRAPAINMPDWFKVLVELVAASDGTNFANQLKVAVLVQVQNVAGGLDTQVQFNDLGRTAGAVGLTYDKASRTVKLAGQSLTAAQAQPLLDLATTWNTTGSPTAIKLNVTNTLSGASAKLIDLQVGGASKFYVTPKGMVVAAPVVNDWDTGGFMCANGQTVLRGTVQFYTSGYDCRHYFDGYGTIQIGRCGSLKWTSSNGAIDSAADVAFWRSGPGVLELTTGEPFTPMVGVSVGGNPLADLRLRNIIYATPAADNTASGPTTSDFNCGYTSSVVGELVYLDAAFTWQKASAAPGTLYKYMLGIALEVKAAGQAMKVALPGATVWASAVLPTLNNGPVFMSETPGQMTQTEPSTPDSATRCVGWGVHADKMYFFPSPDYGTHL